MIDYSRFKQQKGATLVVVLMLLLIVMLLALSIAASTTSRSLAVNTNVLKAQSIEAAETGSNVLLTLLKEGLNADLIDDCSKSYTDQFSEFESKRSTISSSSDDKRSVTLSWYACKPKNSINVCNSSTVTDCFSVVITGVACYGNITDPANEACTVSRYLQGYAIKK